MFTVACTQAALDELAFVWVSSDTKTRNQITAATTLLDRHLRANAPRLGESRDDEDFRLLIVEPIGIEFLVSEEDRLVTVFRAWRLSPLS